MLKVLWVGATNSRRDDAAPFLRARAIWRLCFCPTSGEGSRGRCASPNPDPGQDPGSSPSFPISRWSRRVAAQIFQPHSLLRRSFFAPPDPAGPGFLDARRYVTLFVSQQLLDPLFSPAT